jgi:Spy/CpxP family protein refolding chaperone
MNSRAIILGLSLVGNVVLATFVLRQHPDSTADAESPANSQTGTTAQATDSANSESPSATESTASILNTSDDSPGAFQWSQLEAADYKEYIARLRAFGVPEKVVRDIIIADVNKLYRPRFAALLPPKKPKNEKFWETRNQSYFPERDMTKEQRAQTTALRKEQQNLLKELLGADFYEQIAKEAGYPDYNERMFGQLSKEVRDKVSEMNERFQDERTAFYAKTEGYMDQDSQAEMAAIRKKFRAELATVLTPEQLEDYELRSSETAQRMKWELSSFDPDEKEFRAIHAHKQAMEELDAARNNEDKPLTPDEQKELQKKRKELEASLADKLGTNRVAEYKLMDSYEYRSLLDAGVPKESVFKIPDIKKEAEAAASKLRNDKSLTSEQRTAALNEIKNETTKTLTDLLGSRRANYYQQSGGYWLRNLAPQTTVTFE